MRAGPIVIGLTVVVAAGGLYLYRAIGTDDAAPAPTSAPPAARAPDRSSATRPAAPRRDLTAPTIAPAPTPTPAAGSDVAPGSVEPLAPGQPGPRADFRRQPMTAPGLVDPAERTAGLADVPSDPQLSDDARAALQAARTEFRAGDFAGTRSLARKILATAPGSTAARRLAVSASCRLGDAAGARADAAGLSRNERAAVVRYCADANVTLDPQ